MNFDALYESAILANRVYLHHNITSQYSQASVYQKNNLNYIVIAGSDSIFDLMDDLTAFKANTSDGGVNKGFLIYYDLLHPKIIAKLDKSLPTRIIGHSLGASGSLLCASRLFEEGYQIESVYLFGCPPTFDSIYRSNYEKMNIETHRIIHGADMIPSLYSIGDHQVGNPIYISREGEILDKQQNKKWFPNPFEWFYSKFKDHKMDGYQHSIYLLRRKNIK